MPKRFGYCITLVLVVVIGIVVFVTLIKYHRTLKDPEAWYPHNFNYTINHADLCDSNQTIRLLIMVHTAGDHFRSRLTIRRTWGSVVKRKDVRLLFLLGYPVHEDLQQHILDEEETFGDIVQEDFLDTYHNLTLKSIMMVKWVTTHCPNARYVLKIDDDCFLNPDSLLVFLSQNLTDVAIYGRVWRSGSPHRDKKSKWYVSKEMYPKHRYPDFAAGPSYLLTQKAVHLLYLTALTTKSIYLEDVYLNGMCAEKAKISRIHNEEFYVDSGKLKKVDIIRNVITSHEFSSYHLSLLWWLMHDTRGVRMDTVLDNGGSYLRYERKNWTIGTTES